MTNSIVISLEFHQKIKMMTTQAKHNAINDLIIKQGQILIRKTNIHTTKQQMCFDYFYQLFSKLETISVKVGYEYEKKQKINQGIIDTRELEKKITENKLSLAEIENQSLALLHAVIEMYLS